MNYSNMKLSELKTELKNKGIKMTGNKKDLIERLEENDKIIENRSKKDQPKKKVVKKSNKTDQESEPKKDTQTALQKKLDKLIEKEEKAALKDRENMDKSLLELSFKTLSGSWYTVHIKGDATLEELRKEVAKKTNTDRFVLYRLTHREDPHISIGDIMYQDGTVHHMLANDDDEKQLNELGIINETMFFIAIRLR